MNRPLVTVIVVCYNQASYIREALESVYKQTYDNIEVVVVDDGSDDASVLEVNKLEAEGLRFTKILIPKQRGYCQAFNQALRLANGNYIIDLSADDFLLPERVEEGVIALKRSKAGVNFCDAFYIDDRSKTLDTHYRRDINGCITEQVPEGYIFKNILARYFICAPTMMIDLKVFEALEGYDEELYYEDFDFWVRSSRLFKYSFTDKVLVKKRVHQESMSKSQYLPKSKMLPTTLKVCQKAFNLCRSKEELLALKVRINYELRQAVVSNNYLVADGFHELLGLTSKHSLGYKVWAWLLVIRWNFSFLTKLIGKAR